VFWDVVGSLSNSGWRGTFYFVFVFFVSLAGLSPCLANYKPKVYSSFSSLMNDRAPAEFFKNVMSNTKKDSFEPAYKLPMLFNHGCYGELSSPIDFPGLGSCGGARHKMQRV
jgi:hypothetical protein